MILYVTYKFDCESNEYFLDHMLVMNVLSFKTQTIRIFGKIINSEDIQEEHMPLYEFFFGGMTALRVTFQRTYESYLGTCLL